jgi:hypothetical protein
MKLNANGIIIQRLNNPTHFVTKFPYNGIHAYYQDALLGIKDEKCIELCKKTFSKECDDGLCQILEFISDINLAKEYALECKNHGIPTRILFIESTYSDEIWQSELPQLKFLGYEYSPIPWDDQVVTDFNWYNPLHQFIPKLNCNGLFNSIEEVAAFKKVYDVAVNNGDIGDNVEAYICRVSELLL